MTTYSEQLALLVEDFINTYDTYLEQPEKLGTPDDLRAFLTEHGLTVETSLDARILDEARGLRTTLRQIWEAHNLAELAEQLNALWEDTQITPQIQVTDGHSWTLTFVTDAKMPLIKRLAVAGGLGILGIVERYGLERMRACDSAPCHDVFVDTSRNRSRRFCSERCANRYNIAAFRERQQHG